MHGLTTAVAFLAVTSLHAQDVAVAPARARVFGKVVGMDGRGIANARVHLVSRPVRRMMVGLADRMAVTTTDRGAFKARLLEGRGYTVWAEIQEEGRVALTNVIESAAAGRPIRLVRETTWPKLQLLVKGRAQWDAQALEIQVMSPTRNVTLSKLKLDADGRAEIPPMPGRSARLLIRTKSGIVVAMKSISLSSDARIEVELARPITVDLHVKSKATGKPLDGAWVAQIPGMLSLGGFVSPRQIEMRGKTNKGHLQLRMPENMEFRRDQSAIEQYLLVGAPGHPATYVSVAGEGDRRQVDLFLEAGSSVSGRILGLDGKPVPRAQLLILSYARADGHPGLHAGVPPIPIRCGPDGRFVFDGVTDRDEFYIVALTQGLGLPARFTHPLQWLVKHPAATKPETKLGDLALADLTELELQVRRGDGAPASLARLVHEERKLNWIDHVTDSRGQLRMLCPKGRLGFGAFELRGGVGFGEWELPAGTSKQTLRLSKPYSVTARVSGADGKPMAGAWVRLWNRPAGVPRRLMDLCFQQQRYRVLTNEAGDFEIQAAGLPGDYNLRIGHRSKAGWTSSEVIPVTIDSERTSLPALRIRLPAATPTGPKK